MNVYDQDDVQAWKSISLLLEVLFSFLNFVDFALCCCLLGQGLKTILQQWEQEPFLQEIGAQGVTNVIVLMLVRASHTLFKKLSNDSYSFQP